jgi:hypothetical protein
MTCRIENRVIVVVEVAVGVIVLVGVGDWLGAEEVVGNRVAKTGMFTVFPLVISIPRNPRLPGRLYPGRQPHAENPK